MCWRSTTSGRSGVVSAGVFYKHLTDYIYIYTLQQAINGVQYQVTQPLNGQAATLTGLEVAVQNQLRFLPAPFNGIGLYANYTFTDSTAQFPNHQGNSTLPGQSRHVGNVAVSYERAGFSGRGSVNFHGSYIDVVGADNTRIAFTIRTGSSTSRRRRRSRATSVSTSTCST